MQNVSTDVPDEKIGIFISMFPELHETFILRELAALERRGLDFTIFSLQYPRDEVTIEDASRLMNERTVYGQLLGVRALLAFFIVFATRPLRVLKAMINVVRVGRDRPSEMIKSLAILPLTLHFGRQAQRQGISHVHGHWANVPTTACWYLANILDLTWSAAIHGEDIFTPNRFLGYKLDQALFTVVCSGLFCNHIKCGIGMDHPEHVYLNYHGLDPRVMLLARDISGAREPGDTFQLVSIGRLVPTKGHDMLIKAVAHLIKEQRVAVTLNLIGSGPEEAALKQLAIDEDVADAVVFKGAMAFENVLATLQQSDVFCLAPRMIPGHPPDGIPNVIAEAMALHLPVVTTRVSAIPELIDDGVSGLLVEEDDQAGFNKALTRMIMDDELRTVIAEQAFDKVGVLFNQDKNIDELLGYFNHHLATRPS